MAMPSKFIGADMRKRVDIGKKEAKVPITSTSANLSGGENPVTAKEAIRQIGDKVDLVLDAGKCNYGKPSTVVDLSSGKIEVVREGTISKEELLKI